MTISESGCPIVHKITETDAERTEIENYSFGVDATGTLQQVYGVWTKDPVTRFFYLQATSYSMNMDTMVANSFTRYYVKISNPCIMMGSIIN